MLRFLRLLSIYTRGVAYTFRLLLTPKDIFTLLKLGDLLTESQAFELFVNRAEKDAGAAALIEQRYSAGIPSISTLQTFPEGTLGHAFAQHMVQNNLQLYPLSIQPNCSKKVYLRERQREIHDILHAVFGLGIDIKDEAQLNSILVAQSCPPISVLIVAGSILQCLFKSPSQLPDLIEAIITGYSQGKSCKNVFALRWEEMMTWPLTKAKASL